MPGMLGEADWRLAAVSSQKQTRDLSSIMFPQFTSASEQLTKQSDQLVIENVIID